MYIYGVGNGMKGDAIRKKRKTSVSSFKTISDTSDTEEVAATTETTTTPSLANVLALQDVDSPIARQRSAFDHANKLIDDLENYRRQMLLGGDSSQLLAALNQKIAKYRASSDSKELEEAIEHLELRGLIIQEQNKS